jgi:hypothetical protein
VATRPFRPSELEPRARANSRSAAWRLGPSSSPVLVLPIRNLAQGVRTGSPIYASVGYEAGPDHAQRDRASPRSRLRRADSKRHGFSAVAALTARSASSPTGATSHLSAPDGAQAMSPSILLMVAEAQLLGAVVVVTRRELHELPIGSRRIRKLGREARFCDWPFYAKRRAGRQLSLLGPSVRN